MASTSISEVVNATTFYTNHSITTGAPTEDDSGNLGTIIGVLSGVGCLLIICCVCCPCMSSKRGSASVQCSSSCDFIDLIPSPSSCVCRSTDDVSASGGFIVLDDLRVPRIRQSSGGLIVPSTRPSSGGLNVVDEKVLRVTFLRWIKLKYANLKIVRLYIGRQEDKQSISAEKEKIIVLVIDKFEVIPEKFYEFGGKKYLIICKLWKSVPLEGEKVTNREVDCNIDNSTLSTIEECLIKRSKDLFMRHSNLEVISMSAFRSKNNGEEIILEPCIVLFCSCKGVVPHNEDLFPTHFDGIKTDVREGFFYQFPNFETVHKSVDILDPLRMGAIISKKDNSKSGTLGGFVTMDSGDIGFITSAHVFHGVSDYFNFQKNFEIVQPSHGFGDPNVCGKYEKSFCTAGLFGGHTIDAALVKVTNRNPTRGFFAGMTEEQLLDAGYSLEMLPEYDNGAIRDFRQEQTNRTHLCVKFGAVSGLTRGMLWINGMSVRWNNDFITLGIPSFRSEVKYFKQLQIIGMQNLSFAQPGDSGALVFQIDPDKTNVQRLVCIGMVVGGTSDNKTVVTPIGPILEALNVKMHTFNAEKMDES